MTDEEKKLGEPLTIEELRGMMDVSQEIIGAFVMVCDDGVLCCGVLDERTDDGICVSTGASNNWLKEKDYGKTWLAYRYPTVATDTDVGSKLDSWEPCELCRSCENCKNIGYAHMVCLNCHEYSKFAPRNFCHECGRPLTPEARTMLEKRLRGRLISVCPYCLGGGKYGRSI